MAHPLFFLAVCLVLAPAATAHNLQSNEEGYISLLLSNKGVDFAKDVLINKAVSTIIPLQLPDIEKSVKIPLIGKVHMILSNITIYSVNISSSYVETGNPGLVLVASGATASLSMKWAYSYSTWLIVISDSGDASVQVHIYGTGVHLFTSSFSPLHVFFKSAQVLGFGKHGCFLIVSACYFC